MRGGAGTRQRELGFVGGSGENEGRFSTALQLGNGLKIFSSRRNAPSRSRRGAARLIGGLPEAQPNLRDPRRLGGLSVHWRSFGEPVFSFFRQRPSPTARFQPAPGS